MGEGKGEGMCPIVNILAQNACSDDCVRLSLFSFHSTRFAKENWICGQAMRGLEGLAPHFSLTLCDMVDVTEGLWNLPPFLTRE